jgi:hypothetical protein
VKSKRVRRHHLNDGDIIVLGRHEIMYLDERAGKLRSAGVERKRTPGNDGNEDA